MYSSYTLKNYEIKVIIASNPAPCVELTVCIDNCVSMTIIRIVQLKLKASLQGYTTKDRQLFQSYLVGYGKKTDNSCVP